MKQLLIGILIGSALTGSLAAAGNFYGKDGSVQAPAGSTQRFDYYRERQAQLDIGAMRRQMDKDRLNQQLHPCGK